MSPEELAERLESLDLDLDDWHHEDHLSVAALWVRQLGPDRAMDRMRTALQRYLEAQGVETTLERGYHETLTRFWIDEVDDFLAGRAPEEPLEALLPDLHAALGDKRRILEHYDRETLTCWEARLHVLPRQR